MPINERKEPWLISPEELDKLGLPRRSGVISSGFAEPSGKRPKTGTPTQTGQKPPASGSRNMWRGNHPSPPTWGKLNEVSVDEENIVGVQTSAIRTVAAA